MDDKSAALAISIGVWLFTFASDFIVIFLPLTIFFSLVGALVIYYSVNLHYKILNKKFSKYYYLLPITLGFIGSIIAYYGFKKNSKKVASSLAWLGMEVSIVYIALNILAGMVIISLIA